MELARFHSQLALAQQPGGDCFPSRSRQTPVAMHPSSMLGAGVDLIPKALTYLDSYLDD